MQHLRLPCFVPNDSRLRSSTSCGGCAAWVALRSPLVEFWAVRPARSMPLSCVQEESSQPPENGPSDISAQTRGKRSRVVWQAVSPSEASREPFRDRPRRSVARSHGTKDAFGIERRMPTDEPGSEDGAPNWASSSGERIDPSGRSSYRSSCWTGPRNRSQARRASSSRTPACISLMKASTAPFLSRPGVRFERSSRAISGAGRACEGLPRARRSDPPAEPFKMAFRFASAHQRSKTVRSLDTGRATSSAARRARRSQHWSSARHVS